MHRTLDGAAAEAARAIEQAHNRYRDRFQHLTRRARDRFEARDWKGALADATERLDLYAGVVADIERQVRETLDGRISERRLWAATKAVYSGLIAERPDWELAETFLNSVTRRIFATAGVDPNIEFIDPDFDDRSRPAS